LASQLKALQITLDHALLPALLPEVTTKWNQNETKMKPKWNKNETKWDKMN
jgi:hypothetical protein